MYGLVDRNMPLEEGPESRMLHSISTFFLSASSYYCCVMLAALPVPFLL